MPLEQDIVARIHSDFDESEISSALEVLNASEKHGRVARCIVIAAGGSLEELRTYANLAQEDSRDVIMAAEYDPTHERTRDLRASFLIDEPQKFWIGELADALQARQYVLRSLESRKATAGPFQYTSDSGEGVVEFDGERGPITIEKKDRCWSLQGDPGVLEHYGLDKPFEDEAAFRDAVSSYLLVKSR